MDEHEYEVWSTVKVTGVAYVTASSAAEAVEKGLNAHELEIEFHFSEGHSETKMRARRVHRPRDGTP